MTVHDQMAVELQRLAGSSGPVTATVAGPDGLTITADLTAVDSLACSVEAVRAEVPRLANAGFDTLRTWGDSLCRRLTYLLETFAPLEADAEAGQVLIRSNPPDRQGDATQFYEVLLSRDSTGAFVLRRYRAEKGVPGRLPVEMHLTHEVLGRLVRDLAETVPTGP